MHFDGKGRFLRPLAGRETIGFYRLTVVKASSILLKKDEFGEYFQEKSDIFILIQFNVHEHSKIM